MNGANDVCQCFVLKNNLLILLNVMSGPTAEQGLRSLLRSQPIFFNVCDNVLRSLHKILKVTTCAEVEDSSLVMQINQVNLP